MKFQETRHCRWMLMLMVLTFPFIQSVADGPFRQHRYDSWSVLAPPQGAIVFVGNSITDMHNWNEAFGGSSMIVNRGNSGAVSAELLTHMDSWIGCKPSKVFVMIGTNDLGSDSCTASVVRNIRAFVGRVHEKSPATRIYLQSILPAYDQRNRSLQTIKEANTMIRQYADSLDYADYIDLYDLLLPILNKEPYSLDGLHLEAYGYSLWCNTIEKLVGLKGIYPPHTDLRQRDAGAWGSNGMRATYFSMYPIEEGDVLFFGDEMVKNGEWNELLPLTPIKNRGTGWGYGGNIALTRAMAEATFADNGTAKERPSRMIIYTGTDDVNSTASLDSVKLHYKALVERMHEYAPGVPIAVLSLMPTMSFSSRIADFNDWLRQWAADDKDLTFVDIYHELATGEGFADTTYIRDNYLYGKGYLKVAELLRALPEIR